MMVFFKRLPIGISKTDLAVFISEALNGGWFFKRGRIVNINIIEKRNSLQNITECHAIVTIEPDSAAQRVIQKLHRKLFQGKYLEVRRYYVRNLLNDPRNKKNVFDEPPDHYQRTERRQEDE
jgi:hypothetical protein